MPRVQRALIQICLVVGDLGLAVLRWSRLLLVVLAVLVTLSILAPWIPFVARSLTALGLVQENHSLRLLHFGGALLASCEVGRALYGLWFGWHTRALYAGLPLDDQPEEHFLPVVVARLGIAVGWTVVIVSTVLFWCLVIVSAAPVSAIPVHVAVRTLLSEQSAWLSFIVFAFTMPRQCDRIWRDLDRAQEHEWDRKKEVSRNEQRDGRHDVLLPRSRNGSVGNRQ